MDYTQYLRELTSRPIPKKRPSRGGIPPPGGRRPGVHGRAGPGRASRHIHPERLLHERLPGLRRRPLRLPGAARRRESRCCRWRSSRSPAPSSAAGSRMSGASGGPTRMPSAPSWRPAEGPQLDGKRIGVETKRSGLSVDVHEGLKRALPGATFVDASDWWPRARLIKSPGELDHMRSRPDHPEGHRGGRQRRQARRHRERHRQRGLPGPGQGGQRVLQQPADRRRGLTGPAGSIRRFKRTPIRAGQTA